MWQCAMRLGAVILLTPTRGITTDSHVTLSTNLFAVIAKAQAKLEPQLAGAALSL
jgi:hypothetical protein